MKTQDENNFLFRLATRFLKYFLLFASGLAIACMMSMSFGGTKLAMMLLPVVVEWLGRLALILVGLFGAAIIIESVAKK